MTALWQPGTQYNLGDEVSYNGARYRIIQAHRSQGDWTPDITPALWGRMQEPAPTHCNPPASSNQPQQPQYGYGNQQPQQPPSYDGHKPSSGHDSDSDDGKGGNKKKIFGLAAGLLGGGALIGAGILAYKHHEKSEEEKAALKAGYEKWYREAEQRASAFHSKGPSAPFTWLLNKGKRIPQYAITTGREKDWSLYICRAFFDGGILIGKASDVFEKGGVIGYKHDEHPIDTYEILLGNMDHLKWVRTRGKFNVRNLNGAKPIEGGRENDGTLLYVVKAEHKGATHPGKASEVLDGAYIPYGGKEVKVEEYEVLCWK